MKAKFITKIYDRYGKYVDLEYEYRGRTYFVRNRFNGNALGESLRDQHLENQRSIDQALDHKSEPEDKVTTGYFDPDEIFKLLEMEV